MILSGKVYEWSYNFHWSIKSIRAVASLVLLLAVKTKKQLNDALQRLP